MKAKEVVFLVLIICAGVVFYHLQTGKWMDVMPWGTDIFFGGKTHVFEDTEKIEIPEPQVLEIENRHGDVEVLGMEGRTTLEVTLRKEIRSKTEEDALNVSRRLSTLVSRKEGRVRITTNRGDFRRPNFRTHIHILAPRAAVVEIRNAHGAVDAFDLGSVTVVNRHGRVRVASIAGDADVANSHAAIEIEDVDGDCAVTARHGHIRIRSVHGDAVVSNSFGKTRVEDVYGKTGISGRHNAVTGIRLGEAVRVSNTHDKVTLTDIGPADIEGRHSDITVRSAGGDVGIATHYGKVSIEDIRGGVSVKGRNVRVRGRNILGGDIRIETTHENLDLDDFTGPAEITVSNAQIRLAPRSPGDGLRVSNRYGGIRVLWPSDTAVPLEARARGGRVVWRLPGPPPFTETNRTSLLRAFMVEGEEPRVVLSSDYGDIRIEESLRED